MMKLRLSLLAAIFLATLAQAQSPPDLSPTTITLWPNGTPGALGSAPEDIPRLLAFLPARVKTSTAVLILPGGGYSHLSLPTEGVEIARFMSAAGIPAFVLEYRLATRYRHPTQLRDAERAMRYLRANSAMYRIQKIGVMGFSAGGHLASELGISGAPADPAAIDPLDRPATRPDFMVLAYPVIGPWGFAAEGSLRNIDPNTSHPVVSPKPNIPTDPPINPALVQLLSTDLHVTAQTPATFLVCADDDRSVFPENSARFYLALRAAGVPAELHIYAHGRHGFGLAAYDPIDTTWTAHMLDWLRTNSFLDPPLPIKP